MNIEISVFDPNQDLRIEFSAYQFEHIGCSQMSSRREVAYGEYILRCDCGLEVHIPWLGDAATAISNAITDQQSVVLVPGSFHSNRGDTVIIRPRYSS